MVEHPAVNRRVVGSNPTHGAKVPMMYRDFPFMTYFMYILYSLNGDRYYTGSSENPPRRVTFHNTIEKGFTSRYRPWKLVYTKEYKSKVLAQRAEKKVKSWKSRQMIEKLIAGEIQL
jgi:putative endonuclease